MKKFINKIIYLLLSVADIRELQSALIGKYLVNAIEEYQKWLRDNYKYNKGDIDADSAYEASMKLWKFIGEEGITNDHPAFR